MKKNMFDFRIKINNQKINDVIPYLNEFEQHLKSKISEIFKIEIPFTKSENKDSCKYCPYKKLCSG